MNKHSKQADRRCLAEDCTTPLTTSYCINRHLCVTHLRADSLTQRGHGSTLFRFCQQCGKLQPLSCFDGNKRSCRQQLARRRGSAPTQQCRRSSCTTCATRAADADGSNKTTRRSSLDVSACVAVSNHKITAACGSGSMASAAASVGALAAVCNGAFTPAGDGRVQDLGPTAGMAVTAFANPVTFCANGGPGAAADAQLWQLEQLQPWQQQHQQQLELVPICCALESDGSMVRMQQLQTQLDAMQHQLERLLNKGTAGAAADTAVQQQHQQHQQGQGQPMLDVSPPVFAPTPEDTLFPWVPGAAAAAAFIKTATAAPAAAQLQKAAPGASTAAAMYTRLLPALSNGDAFTAGCANASYISSHSLAGLQGHNRQSAGYSQTLYSQPGMGAVQPKPTWLTEKAAPAAPEAAAASSQCHAAQGRHPAPLPGLLLHQVTWDDLLLQQLGASCVELSREMASISNHSNSLQRHQSDNQLVEAAGTAAHSSGAHTLAGLPDAVAPGTKVYPMLQGAADPQSSSVEATPVPVFSFSSPTSMSASLAAAAAGLEKLDLDGATASGQNVTTAAAEASARSAEQHNLIRDEDIEDLLEMALLEAGAEALRERSAGSRAAWPHASP